MTDIPIIMSGPMIRALIDGRKTMTRRLAWREQTEEQERADVRAGRHPHLLPSPWQKVKPGDRLWVRENVRCGGNGVWRYAANDVTIAATNSARGAAMVAWAHHEERESVPSIHMPRILSRLTLIVTATKIEKLQDISKADVIAEGITEREGAPLADVHAGWHEPFAQLWDKLHGTGAWQANPEVVAIGFRPILANIDAAEARAA